MPPRIRWFSIDRLFRKGSLCQGAFFILPQPAAEKLSRCFLRPVYSAKGTHIIIRINIVRHFLKKC